MDKNEYIMSESIILLKELLYDVKFHKQFIEYELFDKIVNYFNENSKYMVNLSHSPKTVEVFQNICEFLVETSKLSNLHGELIGEGIIPILLNLLNLTRVEEILLPILAFIYFISENKIAREELIDSRDLDCIVNLIDQSSLFPKLSLAAEECFIRLGGITSVCTVAILEKSMEYQEVFRCKTCGIEAVCNSCSQICHKGHALSAVRIELASCSCGSSEHCLIKQRPNLRTQMPLRICSIAFTGNKYSTQMWYKCHTCFRNDPKGICSTCAITCHLGHDVHFGGESDFYCDCVTRYGSVCKAAQHAILSAGSVPKLRKKHVRDPTAPVNSEKKTTNTECNENCSECKVAPKDALFISCGHIVSCIDCVSKNKPSSCIVCKSTIVEVLRVFGV